MPRSLLGVLVLVVCALPLSRLAAQDYDSAAILSAARVADEVYRRHLSLLALQLKSPVLSDRLAAIRTIAVLMDPSTVGLLLPSIATARDPAEQEAGAVALGHLGQVAATPALRELLDHAPAPIARQAALNALEQIKAAQGTDYLLKTKDADPVLQSAALTNAGTIAFDKAIDALVYGLEHDRRQVTRRMCAIGIGRIGDRSQGPALLDALGDADPGVRRYAAEALVKLNYTPAIPYLLMALEGNSAGAYINHCLMLMTNQDFGFDWRSSDVARSEAVERGFHWWTDHAAELSH